MGGCIDFNIYNLNQEESFFSRWLNHRGLLTAKVINNAFDWQQDEIELFASENIVSRQCSTDLRSKDQKKYKN